ncbi:MAG: hypothetical protein HXO03_06700 [Prevotella salivae]|nr:hypothetical protein [Segatella salivae]
MTALLRDICLNELTGSSRPLAAAQSVWLLCYSALSTQSKQAVFCPFPFGYP